VGYKWMPKGIKFFSLFSKAEDRFNRAGLKKSKPLPSVMPQKLVLGETSKGFIRLTPTGGKTDGFLRRRSWGQGNRRQIRGKGIQIKSSLKIQTDLNP